MTTDDVVICLQDFISRTYKLSKQAPWFEKVFLLNTVKDKIAILMDIKMHFIAWHSNIYEHKEFLI